MGKNASRDGLQELIDKLEGINEDSLSKIEKEVLNEVGEKIEKDMKSVAPVSKVRDIHGVDAIKKGNVSRLGQRMSIKIGLSEVLRGHGGDYWTQIRGLWFQNFKTDEPNYGWFDKFRDANKKNYVKEVREKLKDKINNLLK